MARRQPDDLDAALADRDDDRDDDRDRGRDRGGRRRRDRDEPDNDSQDDADQDDADDADDDDDADDVRPPAKRKTAAERLAELEDELKRKDRALRRARRDARAARQRRPAASARRDRDDDRDDDRDRDDAPRRSRRDDRDDDQPTVAEKRQLSRARTEAAQAKGEAALMRAGADPSLAALAAGKLDAEAVDWSDRDDVASWVEEMRDEYPALFGKRRRADQDDDDDEDDRPAPRRRRSSVDQGAGSTARTRRDGPKPTVGQLAVQRGRAYDQAVQRVSRRR